MPQAGPIQDNQAVAVPARQNKRWSWKEIILQSFASMIALAVVAAAYQFALIILNPVEPAVPVTAATAAPTAIPAVDPPPFEPYALPVTGVIRLAEPHTFRPDVSRFQITEYEVQKGDTVIGIAEKYGLRPQTIFWGNLDTLYDDPHRLQPGQKLRILPVDGLLYEWHEGDGLNGVSNFFGVTPEDIINWPGNNLNPEAIGDYAHPNITAGTRLVVPGGEREFISYSAPFISRENPASAKLFGPGYCGQVVDGYIGSSTFVWPTTQQYLSGYDYDPSTNHWGIDIAGQTGNPVYATDSGVVVYSGLNNSGYGLVVIIDHGNGYQSLYAHLSQINAGCGASVSQGAVIGALGSTGRSTGPHLHFEIMDAGGNRINPHLFF